MSQWCWHVPAIVPCHFTVFGAYPLSLGVVSLSRNNSSALRGTDPAAYPCAARCRPSPTQEYYFNVRHGRAGVWLLAWATGAAMLVLMAVFLLSAMCCGGISPVLCVAWMGPHLGISACICIRRRRRARLRHVRVVVRLLRV